jgi:SOS-response transcriptional repressor LexA
MFVSDLRETLTELLRTKVRNGTTTERSLAKQIGMSQPHLHNVLKGTRTLSTEMIDQCLYQLRLSVFDLMDRSAMTAYLGRQEQDRTRVVYLPVLDGAIGPTSPWPAEVQTKDRFPVDEDLVRNMWQPIIAQASFDARMRSSVADGDFFLLDQSTKARLDFRDDCLYVIKNGKSGLVRRIRRQGDFIFAVADDTLYRQALWEKLPATGAQILHFVRAKVTLLSRAHDWSASRGEK